MNNPNILLCTVDSFRKDRVDEDITPYTKELADEGVWFDNMQATAPATAASFVGLMASRLYSDTEGIGLPEEEFRTLAEVLSENGYTNIGHSTNQFTSSYYNYDRGFDKFQSPTSGLKFLIRKHLDEDGPLFRFLEWGYHIWLQTNASSSEHQLSWWNEPAESVNDNLLSWQRDLEDPWFMWAHHMDIHHPLEPPEEYLPDSVPDRGYGQRISRELPGRIPEGRGEDMSAIRDLYEAECRYWDDEFKKLHSELPDDTLTIVVGDHGELLGEHGRFGHPHEMWKELLNVPCLVHHPDIESDRIEELQTTIDLAPMILSLAGCDTPPEMRGKPIDIDDVSEREQIYGTIETPDHVGMSMNPEYKWVRHMSRRSTQEEHGELLFATGSEESLESGRSMKTSNNQIARKLRNNFDETTSGESVLAMAADDEQVRRHLADLGYLQQE